MIPNDIWLFHSDTGRFSTGAFSSLEGAEHWIRQHQLTGVLTRYPLDAGVYEWAITNGLFEPAKELEHSSDFIGRFTSASQEHYHYENGER